MTLPSVYLSRKPHYIPHTDCNSQTLRVADWLEREGFTRAAQVLRAEMTPNETVTLVELCSNEGLLKELLADPNLLVRIWSSCYDPYAYWRPDARGYTADRLSAGLYTMDQAWKASSHVCYNGKDEKGITYELLDTTAKADDLMSGWKS